MTLYIGIDPGLTGALGWLIDSGHEHAGTIDPATATVKVGTATRSDYLVPAMAASVAELCARWPGHEPRAVLEKVSVRPLESVSAAMKTGRGSGIWEGILSALTIPYETVDPARWKKAVGLAVRAGKSESRVLAAMQFPQLAGDLVRAKDDGRAEALLIAMWLQRRETK